MARATAARTGSANRFMCYPLTAPPPRSSRTQILVEPGQGACPRQLRRGLVVARRRVVVKAVTGFRVDVTLVRNSGSRQGRVVGRPRRREAGIGLTVMHED